MSKNKLKLIVVLTAVVAFVLRLVQLFVLIDHKTGFYERRLSTFGTIFTIAILCACGVAAIMSRKAFTIKKNEFGILSSVTALILSVALIYELFFERIALEGVAWQAVSMKTVGFITAVYFGAIAFSKLFGYKLPDLLHIIPTFYMLIRIVCSFINVTALSLIAENIFYITGLCCLLMFFVGYAGLFALEKIDEKSLNLRTVLTASICFITSASNIAVSAVADGGYHHIPTHSLVVMLAFSLFIIAFSFDFRFEIKE